MLKNNNKKNYVYCVVLLSMLQNDSNPFVTTEFEPCFEAADFMRAGKDLFVQRSQVQLLYHTICNSIEMHTIYIIPIIVLSTISYDNILRVYQSFQNNFSLHYKTLQHCTELQVHVVSTLTHINKVNSLGTHVASYYCLWLLLGKKNCDFLCCFK